MSQPFFSRRRFLIAMVLVALLPFIWRGTRQALLSNRNDVRDWLPAHFEQTADHRWFQGHFPHEQFVLCSWDGCTLDEDDPRLELLAKKLVPDEAPEAAPAEVASPRPLAQVVQESSEDPQFFQSVITGPRLVRELAERYRSLSREEILERLEGTLIGPDHEKTCLVVTLTKEAEGKNLRPMVEKIHEYARQCNIEPELAEDQRNVLVKVWDGGILVAREMMFGREPPSGGLRMGGPPVDNVAIDVEGERTLFRLAGLSLVVGLGISMACFRSWRLTMMVFWVALLAAGTGLAAVFWTGSSVDAVMLSMPSLVYVLAISGAIHIVNYYHDAVRETGLVGAPERGLAHGWFPCTMAAITTAIGLGSLYRSHVIPISKFGVYSAIGVLATLALLFLLLPAMLSKFPSRKYAEQHGGRGDTGTADSIVTRFWQAVGRFVIRHNKAVSVGCLVMMGFFAFGLYKIETSVKLMKLFSSDAEIIHDYGWLEDNLGPLVPMEVVLKFDNEKCDLTMLERMRLAHLVERQIEEKLDAVGGALSAATLAPDLRPPRRRRGGFAKIVGLDLRREHDFVLNKRLDANRDEFREYLTIDAEATLAELGITGTLAARLEARELHTLNDITRYGEEESIAANLALIQGIDQDQAAEVEEAIRRFETEHGNELWRVSARVDALSDLDYAVFVDDLMAVVEPVLDWKRDELGFAKDEGIVAVYTGLVPLVYKTQHELLSGLFKSLTMAFILIALVMMFVLKNPGAGLLSMIPNVFPVVMIFGIMGWMGILVDVGSMMTASVALGVAVDDTMHYLTWFRQGLDEGLDREGAAMLAYRRCGTAMTQTTLIGGLGLAAFAFSTFTPTQRFGTLMLVLLFAALFGDLVFLPAILTGPLGRVFGGGKKRKRPDSRLGDDARSTETVEDGAAAPQGQHPATTPHARRDSAHHPRRAP
jgi:predicted RND superfamily exporter protein